MGGEIFWGGGGMNDGGGGMNDVSPPPAEGEGGEEDGPSRHPPGKETPPVSQPHPLHPTRITVL